MYEIEEKLKKEQERFKDNFISLFEENYELIYKLLKKEQQRKINDELIVLLNDKEEVLLNIKLSYKSKTHLIYNITKQSFENDEAHNEEYYTLTALSKLYYYNNNIKDFINIFKKQILSDYKNVINNLMEFGDKITYALRNYEVVIPDFKYETYSYSTLSTDVSLRLYNNELNIIFFIYGEGFVEYDLIHRKVIDLFFDKEDDKETLSEINIRFDDFIYKIRPIIVRLTNIGILKLI